jgi:hypothetical protein
MLRKITAVWKRKVTQDTASGMEISIQTVKTIMGYLLPLPTQVRATMFASGELIEALFLSLSPIEGMKAGDLLEIGGTTYEVRRVQVGKVNCFRGLVEVSAVVTN